MAKFAQTVGERFRGQNSALEELLKKYRKKKTPPPAESVLSRFQSLYPEEENNSTSPVPRRRLSPIKVHKRDEATLARDNIPGREGQGFQWRPFRPPVETSQRTEGIPPLMTRSYEDVFGKPPAQRISARTPFSRALPPVESGGLVPGVVKRYVGSALSKLGQVQEAFGARTVLGQQTLAELDPNRIRRFGAPSEAVMTQKLTDEFMEDYRKQPWWARMLIENYPFMLLPPTAEGAAALRTSEGLLSKIAGYGLEATTLPITERVLGGVLKYGVVIPAKYTGAKAFQTAFDAGLDKWIATQGRLPPETQSILGRILVKDRTWLIEKATNNYITRLEEARAARRGTQWAAQTAADDTIRDIETALVPRGTQTGAMAFGGKRAPKEPWQMTWEEIKTTRKQELVDSLQQIAKVEQEFAKVRAEFDATRVTETKRIKAINNRITRLNPTGEIDKVDSASQRVITKLEVERDALVSKHRNEIIPNRGQYVSANLPKSTIPPSQQMHLESIKQALSEGKPVPAEVFKGYPELVNQVTPTPEVTKRMPPIREGTLPKATIESGYPSETFTFTGEYSEQVAGAASRMATRNKRITGYAPIYKNAKGETISDMTQVVKEIPKAEAGMAPSTSVQTGLPGMGRTSAQSQMLGEVSGKASRKVPLTEAPQVSQALEGQTGFDEVQAEIEGLKSTLEFDPVANYRISLPATRKTKQPDGTYKLTAYNKSVGLDFFISIREQSFPEYFTVKQAEALYPGHSFGAYTQKGTPQYNHVPKDVALDELTKEFKLTPDEIGSRVMNIRQTKARIEALSKQGGEYIGEEPLPAVTATTEAGGVVSEELPPTGRQWSAPRVRDFYQAKIADLEGAARDRIASLKDWAKYSIAERDRVKNILTDYMQEHLPLRERGKLIDAVKNITSQKELDEVITRVDNMAEVASRRTLKAQIETALKKTIPKKQGAILKSRYTADVQKYLDTIRENLHKDRAEVLAKIEENMAAIDAGAVNSAELAHQNELLNMAGIDGMNSVELAELLDFVKTEKAIGVAERLQQYTEAKTKREAIALLITQEITGGKGIIPGRESLALGAQAKKTGAVSSFLNVNRNLATLFDLIAGKSGKLFKDTNLSAFYNENVFKPYLNEEMARDADFKRFSDKAMEILGAADKGELNKILDKMETDKINLGVLKSSDGQDLELEFTANELIAFNQWGQDPSLSRTFTEGMKWTPEIEKAIGDALTTEQKALSDYMMTEYQAFWERWNPVHRAKYGVNLPRNPKYSPASRDFLAEVDEAQLVFQDLHDYGTRLPSAIKARTPNILTLKATDAIKAFNHHIVTMDAWVERSQANQNLRELFGNKDVRIAVEQQYGKKVLAEIDQNIQIVVDNGDKSAKVYRLIDTIRGNFSVAVLANPKQFLNQIPTFMYGLTEMSPLTLTKGLRDFWANPLANLNELMTEHPYIIVRYKAGNIERDMKQALTGKHPGIKRVFFTPMMLGDKFGTIQAYWAKYQEVLAKEGGLNVPGARDKAMTEAGRMSDRIQNTAAVHTLTSLQNAGSIGKAITAYQSQPSKMFQILDTNIRNLRYHRGSPVQAWLAIIMVTLVMTSIFQFTQDALQFRKTRQISAFNPLNNLLVVGQIVQFLQNQLSGDNYQYQAAPIVSIPTQAGYTVSKGRSILKKIFDSASSPATEDWLSLAETALKPAGELFGLPFPYAIQVEKAVRGQEGKRDFRELMFSRYALNKPTVSEELKSKWQSDLKGYNAIPSDPDDVNADRKKYPYTRAEYRKDYPEVEAKLFILGSVTSFTKNDDGAYPARPIAIKLMRELGLTVDDVAGLKLQKNPSRAQKELREYFDSQLGKTPKAPVPQTPVTPVEQAPALPQGRRKSPIKVKKRDED